MIVGIEFFTQISPCAALYSSVSVGSSYHLGAGTPEKKESTFRMKSSFDTETLKKFIR